MFAAQSMRMQQQRNVQAQPSSSHLANQQARLQEQMRQQQQRHKTLKQNFQQSQQDQQKLRQQQAQQQHTLMLQQQQKRQQQQQQAQQQQQQLDSASTFSLPSTMVPPSVLASMYVTPTPDYQQSAMSSSSKNIPHRANAGRSSKSSYKSSSSSSSKHHGTRQAPQAFLDQLLKKRGYHIPRVESDDTGYECVPSPLQLASFGTHLVKAVHTNDSTLLSQLLNCGLSPNPCNQFRDSIVDLVCKRGNATIFECLIRHGADIQVVDGFGRCPLHHAAWASSFCRPIVELILAKDPIQMFLEDKHGQTPLEYITRQNLFADWNDFLEEMADTYWPADGSGKPILRSPRDRRPDGTLRDPRNALPVNLASMVSAGTLSVQDVLSMDEDQRRHFSRRK